MLDSDALEVGEIGLDKVQVTVMKNPSDGVMRLLELGQQLRSDTVAATPNRRPQCDDEACGSGSTLFQQPTDPLGDDVITRSAPSRVQKTYLSLLRHHRKNGQTVCCSNCGVESGPLENYSVGWLSANQGRNVGHPLVEREDAIGMDLIEKNKLLGPDLQTVQEIGLFQNDFHVLCPLQRRVGSSRRKCVNKSGDLFQFLKSKIGGIRAS